MCAIIFFKSHLFLLQNRLKTGNKKAVIFDKILDNIEAPVESSIKGEKCRNDVKKGLEFFQGSHTW